MMINAKYFSEAHKDILEQLGACYQDLFEHSGHGKMSIEMRFLKRGQKEVLINCGREYRFVVDCCEKCAQGKACTNSCADACGLDVHVQEVAPQKRIP